MFKKIFNFGPKKEDKIEWWTAIEGLENIAPVQTSSHFIPDWWQKTPQAVQGRAVACVPGPGGRCLSAYLYRNYGRYRNYGQSLKSPDKSSAVVALKRHLCDGASL